MNKPKYGAQPSFTNGGAIINIAELKNTHRNAAREYRAQLSRHGLVRKSDFPNE